MAKGGAFGGGYGGKPVAPGSGSKQTTSAKADFPGSDVNLGKPLSGEGGGGSILGVPGVKSNADRGHAAMPTSGGSVLGVPGVKENPANPAGPAYDEAADG